MNLVPALKKHFGYSRFGPLQTEIVRARAALYVAGFGQHPSQTCPMSLSAPIARWLGIRRYRSHSIFAEGLEEQDGERMIEPETTQNEKRAD